MASTSMADLLKQAEEAGISSYSPPDGPGTFRVAGANGSKTKKGDPKFGIQWEVVDGPDAGKKFWTNINLIAVKNDGQPNTMGLAMSFRELATLGADADVVAQWDTDSPTISEDVQAAIVGTIISGETKTRESNGYTNVDVKKMKRLESAPAPAAPAAPAQSAPPAAGGTPPPF